MAKRRGRGEGSIFQRHDHPSCPPLIDGERAEHRCRGRWVATISYGIQGGKRDRRTIYGGTKKEVQDKLKTALRQTPSTRPSDMPTVADWLDEWMRDYKPLLRPQTRKSHLSKIEQYIKPLVGAKRLDRLTTLDVERIESRLTMRCPEPDANDKCRHHPHHGLSVSTARQTFMILRDALGDAVKARRITENPAALADAPATYQNQRPHLTTPLADLVLDVAKERGEEARWACALIQGLRQGEALGLVWGLVDLDNGSVSIQRTLEQTGAAGIPKSDASRRTIPLTTRPWMALRALHTQLVAEGRAPAPTDRVFPATPDADRAAWRRLLKAAGVPYVALHSARQSAARRLEEEGREARVAAQFLGHSNVNMTYRYQRGAGLEELRKAIES